LCGFGTCLAELALESGLG